MDPRNAASATPCPDAIEFVRFCYRRRRVGWPELYDEMCAVAGRGLFRGFDADDLAGIGIGFSLFDMPALSVLAGRIVAEEQALRRPVAVMITADDPVKEAHGPTPAPALPSTDLAPLPVPAGDERTFDVPIRLTLVPTGA
jgi:hypothetical protein